MKLATWVRDAKPSFIREILKFTTQPDVISFAGGMPDPDLFPVSAIAEAYARVLAERPGSVLQYSQSEGEISLREAIVERLQSQGVAATVDDVLITNGSQHGLDLVAKALLRPGDVVLMESPTYLGAISAFTPYHPMLVPVDTDNEGMVPDALATAIRTHRPKFVYLVPTFQNPTGRSMSIARRQAIAAVCEEYDVPIVEDDPYSELRFTGDALPAIKSLSRQTIYLGTVSKTLVPSLRLGWLVADNAFLRAAKLALQATCLNVSALTQQVAAHLLASPEHPLHLGQLRTVYRERMHVMAQALQENMPAECSWTVPDGGLFLWVTLPQSARASDLVNAAMERRVAFVPGRPFYLDGVTDAAMRLNFSNANPERIREGIRRLAAALDSTREREPLRA